MVAQLRTDYAPEAARGLHLDIPIHDGRFKGQAKRLIADRFRRIWHIVQVIADEPGQTRRTLADRFHLSERQVQADLAIARGDMRLPLVRRQGYRFVDEGPARDAAGFDLREAQLLVMILRQAMKDRSIPSDALGSLLRKLPGAFAPHLRPLVERTMEAVTAPRTGQQHQVMAALADGLLRGVPVRLHYPVGVMAYAIGDRPVIRPEVMLPYLDDWYVIGEMQTGGLGYERTRSVMLPLGEVTAVTLAAEA